MILWDHGLVGPAKSLVTGPWTPLISTSCRCFVSWPMCNGTRTLGLKKRAWKRMKRHREKVWESWWTVASAIFAMGDDNILPSSCCCPARLAFVTESKIEPYFGCRTPETNILGWKSWQYSRLGDGNCLGRKICPLKGDGKKTPLIMDWMCEVSWFSCQSQDTWLFLFPIIC